MKLRHETPHFNYKIKKVYSWLVALAKRKSCRAIDEKKNPQKITILRWSDKYIRNADNWLNDKTNLDRNI